MLIEWAGKGAQCEQLGHLDEKTGRKLCKWHAMKTKGDSWLQMQDVPCRKRKDSAQGTALDPVNTQGAEKQDMLGCEQSAARFMSPSPATTEERTNHTLYSAQTDARLNHAPDQENTPFDSETKEQFPSARKDSINAETINNDNFLDSATLNPDGHATTVTKEDSVLITTPAIDAPAVGEQALLPAPPQEAVDSPKTTKRADESRDSARALHVRVDSLEPTTTSRLPERETATSTPTAATQAAYQDVVQSLGIARALHSIPPPRRSVHARIDFLNALQAQQASSLSRIAAIYVQCCVCLEKHGEYDMRQVESCKHRYRDLCLRKATKTEGLRRFNCSSCRVWMAEQQKRILDK